MSKHFTPEQVASWPEGHKQCRGCLKILPLENFQRWLKKKVLLKTNPRCKDCESIKRKDWYRSKHPEVLKHRTYQGKVLSREERAWLAGFLEGEGTFSSAVRKDQKNRPRVSLAAHQVNREALDKLVPLIGGVVRGPYQQKNSNASLYYVWGTGGYEAYQYIGSACWAYLTAKRREQFARGLALYRKDT